MSDEKSSQEQNSHKQSENDAGYIYEWCQKYGLNERTADILYRKGIRTPKDICQIQTEFVQGLEVSVGQKCLLRGALLQFKDSDLEYAVFRARKTDPEKAKALEKIHKGHSKKMDRKGIYSLHDCVLMCFFY